MTGYWISSEHPIDGFLNNHGFNLPSESLCNISLKVYNSKLLKVNFKFYVGKKEKEKKVYLQFKLAPPHSSHKCSSAVQNQN
jgi:hypothetical protein